MELTSNLVRDLLKGLCAELLYIYKWKNLPFLYLFYNCQHLFNVFKIGRN